MDVLINMCVVWCCFCEVFRSVFEDDFALGMRNTETDMCMCGHREMWGNH